MDGLMHRRRRKTQKRRNYWLPLLLIIIIGIAAAWYCLGNEYTLKLTMNGDREIRLEYGQPYQEPGAQAQFSGTRFCREPVQVDVTQLGQVNERELGTYEITYIASYKGHTGTAHRRVRIMDSEPPVITLEGSTDVVLLPGQTYEEEGFTATDNCDGDITDQVQRTDEDNTIVYCVTDSVGNTTTAIRNVVYEDPIPPELTLYGDSYLTVKAGSSYSEPGYAATDNCDGDVTDNVTVDGYVDAFSPGTYVLTYSVTDSFQNTASATRTVCVLPVDGEDLMPPNGKVIYLTFDDGPSSNTDALLDVLAKYQVKATFFVVNTACVDTLARIAREGHSIGIHTTTHRFSEIYASDEAFYNDLYTMQGIIEQYAGYKTMLMRFPGGSSNTVSRSYSTGIMTRLTQSVVENGFTYFDWNVDSNDAGGASSADEVFRNVVSGIGNKQKSVVLQHDNKRFSVEAVEKIIVWGLTKGYTFLPLDADSPGCHHGVNN